MTFPKQTLTVVDPGLGVSTPTADTPVFSGKAFGGSAAADTLVSLGSLNDVRTILGFGPLAEDVALCLQQRGGPVFAIVHADSTSPTTTAMTTTGSGPAITLGGLARDEYAAQVQIMAGGALGAGTFRYTLDAFDANSAPITWSQTRIIPMGGSFVIPNSGLTLTFPSGTYILGDLYTESRIPPAPATGDLATVAALLESTPSLVFYLWAVSGAQATASAGATLAAAFEGHLDTLTSTYRYVRGLLDVGSGDTESNVATSAATWTGVRVAPSYGYTLRNSAIPFEGFSTRKTACSSGLAVRAAASLISTDLSRVASGPDVGVLKIYFDENGDQTLDALKIGGMRVWPGIPGFYIANAPLKSQFGSDFTDLQFGRVMDVACRTTYQGQFPYISESLRTLTDGTGAIDPRDAAMIETTVNNQLRDALLNPNNARGIPGHVSAVVYSVDRTANLITSQTLVTTVAIVPLGYSKLITTTLFFTLTA